MVSNGRGTHQMELTALVHQHQGLADTEYQCWWEGTLEMCMPFHPH